jgi:adenosylhomocysteinase
VTATARDTGLANASRVPELPVLRAAMRRWPLESCRLVLVTHVLDTAVPYLRALAELVDIERVVAVPYSFQPSAVALLDDMPLLLPSSLDEISAAAVAAARRSARGAPTILQEVGGYCAPAAGLLAAAGVRGVVEDTKQGQWSYERWPQLPLPVFTIADSPLKALEDAQVGRSIAYSVDRLLRTRFYRLLAECRVTVLGYGSVGVALVDHLLRLGASVGVYDPDPVRRAAALLRGVRVADRAELLAASDVVVGVSGHRALTAGDVGLLPDGVVLASGSSKQVEFDVAGLVSRATTTITAGEVTELIYPDRTVYLLNEGKPVNFLEQSVLGRVLDLVYAELYLCITKLAATPHRARLHRLDRSQQVELAEMWSDCYSRA